LLPLFLFPLARVLYRWWISWEIWYKEQQWTMLEIIPPAEIEKPFKAMEDIFNSLWPMYDGPNWREQWCEGELNQGPFWWSFEIVSLEGNVHFYMRVPKGWARAAESFFHAHYPGAEIFEVEDYTKNVPLDIPNSEYDLYGEDYIYMKDYPFPLLTYSFFEPKTPEAVEGEKKIDPFYTLMEALVKLGPGEQFWFQINPIPIVEDDGRRWQEKCREVADKIARRGTKPKPKSIIGEALRMLFFGKPPFQEEKEEESVLPPEMKLTPGEKEILTAVERKMTKFGFKTFIRALYIYKKDCFFAPHRTIARGYFSHFASQDLNAILFYSKTRTKIHYFFRKRRLYSRKRKIFRRYLERFPSSFPKRRGPLLPIMNSEELATIFHFPTKAASLPPGVPRVMAKKGEAPPGIPFGE